MSVVENVHAVIGKRKTHLESERRRVGSDSSEDDDIDIIDRRVNAIDNIDNNDITILSPQSDNLLLTLPRASTSHNYSINNDNSYANSYDTNYDTIASLHVLRRSLKFFFMSPIDKWRAKGRIPWKLVLQVIKIIVVTIQLIMFGLDMSLYLKQQENVAVSLRQLFLLNWDSIREVMAYPPEAGPYAFYQKDDIFASIDHSIHMFGNISNISVGSVGYRTANSSVTPMSTFQVCAKSYENATIRPSDYFYRIDSKIIIKCIDINNTYPPGDDKWKLFSFKQFIVSRNFSLDFERLVSINLEIPLRTVNINSGSTYSVDCYDVNVNIFYDNSQHSGQILVTLSTVNTIRECDGNLINDEQLSFNRRQAINWLAIVLCLCSVFLCCRSIYRGQQLRVRCVRFFRKHFKKDISFQEKLEFIDGWMIMILLNDILIIYGSVVKVVMEYKSLRGFHYNYCSLLLGIGNLLVWCGLLRYLGFFRKYNILLITLKNAFPHVLRFLLCALILYCGFCFCGWVVLGPYHLKFRTISRTSECLFALMNGDDLFATFAIIKTESILIWWFSRLYLYSFILLFIYVVLSLFIAIIMDSYETIKEYYINGFPMSDLQKFISECDDDLKSYRNDDKNRSNIIYYSWTNLKKFFSLAFSRFHR